MEEAKTENKVAKTQVYNVVILDRSGSMSSIRQAAVDGFNETLAGIKKAQEKFAHTQEHFISLVTFCSCETKNVLDRVPVKEARALKMEDYEPCCCTPLYDAMGFTFTAMRKYIRDLEDAIVIVTIITDGMENDSKEYTEQSIGRLVETLRGEGWTFTYMGANQDSVEVAMKISIRNSRNFAYTGEGTRASMRKDTRTRMSLFACLSQSKEEEVDGSRPTMDRGARHTYYADMANKAFDEEESED